MKKILSLLAITAVVLGMASCKNGNTTDNTINNEPEAPVTRFKITVDEITATSADVTIVPPDEQMYYVYWPFNEATFNWFQQQGDGVENGLKVFEPHQGIYEGKWENMYPNTKYVLCVGEKNKETNTMVGDVEYIRFQTPSMEAKLPTFIDEGQEYLPMTGSCGFMADNLVGFDGEYLLPDGDGEKLVLILYVGSDKLTGHFTTDDLISFFFIVSYVELKDSDDKTVESYAVCGADLTGKFNDATEKYEYKGTVDIYTEDDGLLRLPIFLQCTENKSEN